MESDYMPAVIPLSSYVALQVMLAPSFEKKKKEKSISLFCSINFVHLFLTFP